MTWTAEIVGRFCNVSTVPDPPNDGSGTKMNDSSKSGAPWAATGAQPEGQPAASGGGPKPPPGRSYRIVRASDGGCGSGAAPGRRGP